jgi:DNA-binding transcriptional LysR family regulator
MRMTLRHMEVFRAIMLAGSISGAARMLFVSQSVVSRMLAHLEVRIGFELFERKGRTLRPTENAELLFRNVSDVFEAAGRVESLVEKMRLAPSGRVSLCASGPLCTSVVAGGIQRFRATDAGVHFTVKAALVQDMPPELLGKTVDFCLSIWPIEHPNLTCTPLFGGKLMLAVPRGHPLAEQSRISLAELQHHPVISFLGEMPISGLLRQKLHAASAELTPLVEVNRSEAVCALVEQGVGIGIVYSFGLDERHWSNLGFRELDTDISVHTYLVVSKFSNLSVDARRLIELICQEAQHVGHALHDSAEEFIATGGSHRRS